MSVETTTGKILRRAHINYNLVLKTDLAKQLYGLTLRMANALAALAPQDALSEIITGLEQNLEAEKKAVESLSIQAVTNFPVEFKKQVSAWDIRTIRYLKLLGDLDKIAQQ